MKRTMLLLVALICLLVGGCATEPDLDGTIITMKDGRKFELQHRLLDAYVMHKLPKLERNEATGN